jgi:hypothetical protein
MHAQLGVPRLGVRRDCASIVKPFPLYSFNIRTHGLGAVATSGAPPEEAVPKGWSARSGIDRTPIATLACESSTLDTETLWPNDKHMHGAGQANTYH